MHESLSELPSPRDPTPLEEEIEAESRFTANPAVALNLSVASWGTVSAAQAQAQAQHRMSKCLQGMSRAKSGADDSQLGGRTRVD